MMLSFPSNKTTEFYFQVDVAGTQTPPQKVTVVLEKDATSLSFTATKEGNEWKATIVSPGDTFGIGPVNVSVNVLLNSRLFAPMKAAAEIVGEGRPQDEPTKASPPPYSEPEFKPVPEPVPEPELVMPEAVQPKPNRHSKTGAPKPKKSLMQDVVEAAEKKEAKATARKRAFKVEPKEVKAVPVKETVDPLFKLTKVKVVYR